MSSSEPGRNADERFAPPLDVLRQFARQRATRAPSVQCELCSVEIPEQHRHLLEISNRTLLCVCHPCSILFGDPVAGAGKYRLVPSRYLLLANFVMADEQWDELMIPVNMVYMFYNSNTGRVMAFYPSPAGAIESALPLEGWQALVSSNPILQGMEPDVEALLINRVRNRGSESREQYIVPIDACYELVGLIRLKWKGLSGGEEAWKAIADYFASLRKLATPVEKGTGIDGQEEQDMRTAWQNRAPAGRGGLDAGSEL